MTIHLSRIAHAAYLILLFNSYIAAAELNADEWFQRAISNAQREIDYSRFLTLSVKPFIPPTILPPPSLPPSNPPSNETAIFPAWPSQTGNGTEEHLGSSEQVMRPALDPLYNATGTTWEVVDSPHGPGDSMGPPPGSSHQGGNVPAIVVDIPVPTAIGEVFPETVMGDLTSNIGVDDYQKAGKSTFSGETFLFLTKYSTLHPSTRFTSFAGATLPESFPGTPERVIILSGAAVGAVSIAGVGYYLWRKRRESGSTLEDSLPEDSSEEFDDDDESEDINNGDSDEDSIDDAKLQIGPDAHFWARNADFSAV